MQFTEDNNNILPMCTHACVCMRVYTQVVFTIAERISMKYVRLEMQLLLLPFIICATVALNNTTTKKRLRACSRKHYIHACVFEHIYCFINNCPVHSVNV